MQHFWSLDGVNLSGAWLTIGSFDGVHLGHQAIIRKLTQGARAANAPAVVLTFHPHPSVVLRKREGPFYLTDPEERAALLGELGVDMVVTHPFNIQLASTSAQDFVTYLLSHLGFHHLIIGSDFAFGRNRQGTPEFLKSSGIEMGFSVEVIDTVTSSSEPVSSSRIRQALSKGEVERARSLLGRPYSVVGKIVHGDGRGKLIGIPTANLELWSERALPALGVYACLAEVEGKTLKAVSNVGVRPTFEKEAVLPRVETHLLDFRENLYEKQVKVEFIARLRDEKRFSSVEELINQIHLDIQTAQGILRGI